MTSELKLCKFCGSEMKNCGAPIWEDYCENKECTPLYQKEFFNSLKKSTRAVPDVPELVRLHIDSEGVQECKDGEYVLHSQAAEMLAAKDGVQRAWQDIAKHHTGYENPSMAFRVLLERAEAAEAKLAQYEAQDPIGFVSPSFFDSLNIKNAYSVAAFVVMEKSIKHNTPLYASPAPAADLKAENERLRGDFRKLMSGYVNTLENGMDRIRSLGGSCDDLDTMIANAPYLRDARATLNVESSNDKA